MRDPYVLAEEIFELDAGAGFGVAIFDDDRGLEGEAPLLSCGGGYGARARDDHSILGNDQWLIVFGGIDLVAD